MGGWQALYGQNSKLQLPFFSCCFFFLFFSLFLCMHLIILLTLNYLTFFCFTHYIRVQIITHHSSLTFSKRRGKKRQACSFISIWAEEKELHLASWLLEKWNDNDSKINQLLKKKDFSRKIFYKLESNDNDYTKRWSDIYWPLDNHQNTFFIS